MFSEIDCLSGIEKFWSSRLLLYEQSSFFKIVIDYSVMKSKYFKINKNYFRKTILWIKTVINHSSLWIETVINHSSLVQMSLGGICFDVFFHTILFFSLKTWSLRKKFLYDYKNNSYVLHGVFPQYAIICQKFCVTSPV